MNNFHPVNIITVCYGVAIGWPSASLLVLNSADTPLPSGPLTIEQASWIGSLIALGGLIGNICFGWLSGLVGRKCILLCAVLPQMGGWLLIYVAQSVVYLYAARLLQGFSGGAVYVVMPVFVAEIADSRIRGTLGSMFMLSCNFGIFLAFVMGHVCSYEMVPLLLLGGCVAFLGGVICLPETPQYLLRIGELEVRQKSSSDLQESINVLINVCLSVFSLQRNHCASIGTPAPTPRKSTVCCRPNWSCCAPPTLRL